MLFQLFPAGEDPGQSDASIWQSLQKRRRGVRQKGLENPEIFNDLAAREMLRGMVVGGEDLLCINSCPLLSQPGLFGLRLLSPEKSMEWLVSPSMFIVQLKKPHYLAGAGLSVFSAPSSTVWYP